MKLDLAQVSTNYRAIGERVAAAAQRVGRDPAAVQILAAVKYVGADDLAVLANAGITLVGENRAQELERKAALYPDRFRWHFIGQLQSRKVKTILPLVELIHTVASASALSQLELHRKSDTQVLVQVNIAGEAGKAGIEPDELTDFIARCPVEVIGLMTMPPFADEPEASRPHFAALTQLAAEHGLRELSMGTSQDFEVAIEEGATIVRIGSELYR